LGLILYQTPWPLLIRYSLTELTEIFREYGEDKRAYYLAKAIVAARQEKPIASALELAELIKSKVPVRFRGKIHPATKIFQALRMETNQELENLQTVLPAAADLLIPGGRLVVVSFHSGEDRIVKRFFKDNPVFTILTKRPIVASDSEQRCKSTCS
jgi:16S rRNA (cytosine1402-N4)-methyltransferase